MGRGTRAVMLTTALAGVGAILGTTIGSAQDPAEPTWNCRASVAWIEQTRLPLERIEPIVANGNASATNPDRPSCESDITTLPDIAFGQTDPVITITDPAKAETKVEPSDTAQRNQRTNTATASAAKVAIADANITADLVQSRASVKCVSGAPVFESSSNVTNVSVGGNLLPIDDELLVPISEGLTGSPLAALAKVYVNRSQDTTVGDTTTRTQTALRVELLNAPGEAPVATIVLGETKASYTGDVCADPPPPPTVTTTETIKESVPGPTTTQTVPGPTVTQTQTQTVPGPTRTVQAPPTVVKQTVAVQPNGIPASNCARLSMYFQTNRKKTLSVKFGRERVVTRGRLVTCGGKSIRGARIDVIHVLPSGERRLVKTGMRTRELGRATLILPKNLFTRKIEFRYRPNLASTRVASKQTLSLRVRSKTGKLVTKAPPGQGTVKF